MKKVGYFNKFSISIILYNILISRMYAQVAKWLTRSAAARVFMGSIPIPCFPHSLNIQFVWYGDGE